MHTTKIIYSILLIISLSFLPKPLYAELKIGLVNLGVILKEIPMWRESESKIKKEFEPQQRKIKTMETELNSLNNKYLKNEKIMAKNEKEKLGRKIQETEKEFRSQAEKYTKEFDKVRREELERIKNAVETAINSYANENDFDWIIRSDGTTLYRKNYLDVTQDIISELE